MKVTENELKNIIINWIRSDVREYNMFVKDNKIALNTFVVFSTMELIAK